MSNQRIIGYRDLTESEIALINRIKTHGQSLGDLVKELRTFGDAVDQRWASIGATHMQEGLMALIRSVAKPESF